MKLGIFDFSVAKRGHWFCPELWLDGVCIQTYGMYHAKESATRNGIKALTELFQGALDQLPKPKYQTKSKPVDAVQWYSNLGIKDVHLIDSRFYYKGVRIRRGDWIVNGSVISPGVSARNYKCI